jgi:exonuclease III
MRIINWNVRWAKVKSTWGPVIHEEIFNRDPEVVCITESYKDFFNTGHIITSGEGYGYKITPGRRKVILWSKNPWKNIDMTGNDSLPGGRYVSGITSTSLGDIQFVGVCIPWDGAHVRTGRKNRVKWEDHKTYLEGLKEILNTTTDTTTILVGDFNQRIPRLRQRKDVFDKLMNSIPDNISIATNGTIPVIEKQTIDHVCHTKDLVSKSLSAIDNKTKDGRLLSDHFGVVVDFV